MPEPPRHATEGRGEHRRKASAVAAPTRLVLRLFLVALLALSTGQVLYVTVQDNRAAEEVAERALSGTALALSSAAEKALRAGGDTGEVRSILSDRIVAYALITGPGGLVRFHTNPALVGTRMADDPAEGGADLLDNRGAESVGRRIRLGTGVPAYEFRHALHGVGSDDETLRLILHTTPIDDVMARSRRLDWGVGALIALLWGVGLALDVVGGRLLRLRDEMARKERLTLVGQMTATLSHEIRNALGGVKGYAQWLDEQTAADDPRKKGLALIVKSTGRIEGLVDELLQFSRQETYRIERVAPGPAIAEAVRAAAGSWPGDVAVKVEYGSEVLADEEKLRRVLVNGIRNALEAMPAGGSLTIRARPGGKGRVAITLADTGPGVDEAAADRLFTPFFTTKTDGTGLGLAYSRKVVDEMGGAIELRNGPVGAVLSIILPSA